MQIVYGCAVFSAESQLRGGTCPGDGPGLAFGQDRLRRFVEGSDIDPGFERQRRGREIKTRFELWFDGYKLALVALKPNRVLCDRGEGWRRPEEDAIHAVGIDHVEQRPVTLSQRAIECDVSRRLVKAPFSQQSGFVAAQVPVNVR